MSMKKILLSLLLLCSLYGWTQEDGRVKIKGVVLVPNGDDREGITVYNTSSNTGTITDSEGTFTIAVKEKDRVAFSAIQYNDIIVIIDEGIVNNKRLRLELTQEVRQLRDVVVRPYDLSGNIIVDAQSAKVIKGVSLPEQTIAELEFQNEIKPDELSPATNVAQGGFNFQNGINFVNIFKLVFSKRDTYTIDKKEIKPNVDSEIRKMYDDTFFKKHLDISMEHIGDFIFYAEQQGLDETLLQKGKELDLIEFLLTQSKSFKTQNRKY